MLIAITPFPGRLPRRFQVGRDLEGEPLISCPQTTQLTDVKCCQRLPEKANNLAVFVDEADTNGKGVAQRRFAPFTRLVRQLHNSDKSPFRREIRRAPRTS